MKKIYLLVTTFALTMFSVGQLFSQTITVTGALNAFEKCSGSVSASQNFSVSGASLDDDIDIGGLAGLEHSIDNITFTSTLTLARTAGTVASTTVYVRMTAGDNNAINGNILVTSENAATQTVAASGSENSLSATSTSNNGCYSQNNGTATAVGNVLSPYAYSFLFGIMPAR